MSRPLPHQVSSSNSKMVQKDSVHILADMALGWEFCCGCLCHLQPSDMAAASVTNVRLLSLLRQAFITAWRQVIPFGREQPFSFSMMNLEAHTHSLPACLMSTKQRPFYWQNLDSLHMHKTHLQAQRASWCSCCFLNDFVELARHLLPIGRGLLHEFLYARACA